MCVPRYRRYSVPCRYTTGHLAYFCNSFIYRCVHHPQEAGGGKLIVKFLKGLRKLQYVQQLFFYKRNFSKKKKEFSCLAYVSCWLRVVETGVCKTADILPIICYIRQDLFHSERNTLTPSSPLPMCTPLMMLRQPQTAVTRKEDFTSSQDNIKPGKFLFL